MTIAESGDIVFVSTKVLLFRGSKKLTCDHCEVVERTYFSLNEQNCWLMTCQTISSEDMMNLHRREFWTDYGCMRIYDRIQRYLAVSWRISLDDLELFFHPQILPSSLGLAS